MEELMDVIDKIDNIGYTVGVTLALRWTIGFIKEILGQKDDNFKAQIEQLYADNKVLRDNNREDFKEVSGVLQDVSKVLDNVLTTGERNADTISRAVMDEARKTRDHVTKILDK